ncbi:transcription factor IIA subunit alpha [Madurella fahalii]|uniref:Transcription factor IIA subunit alpha n=1 Tax=Madurella fahalii TaxID=1157608 RepID=A0ABQ0FY12_9PEZI
MSNASVGAVYDIIIQEVISAVRVDFEENGVDDGVLEDLKKKWQVKLSQLNVAQFPWDPKPEPQAAPAAATPQAAPTAANNYTQATLSAQAAPQPLSLPNSLLQNANGVGMKQEAGLIKPEPGIKQEPGLANTGAPIHTGYNPTGAVRGTAAQRAAQALENQYGQRAAASINAIHNGMASQMNPGPQGQQGQRPGQVPQHLSPQQQYRQGVAAAMQQRMQPQIPHAGTQPNGLPAAQVDGSSDADPGPASMSRVEIDSRLHAQIGARAKQIEGGGLMLPLEQATSQRSLAAKKRKDAGAAQVDGPDDDIKDEEFDEDAINSDLDDTDEDGDDDEDEDETMGHMMLCMYDKVQRVKNKWKCILKDGVLTVNNKEYVFHKATGEYEW